MRTVVKNVRLVPVKNKMIFPVNVKICKIFYKEL